MEENLIIEKKLTSMGVDYTQVKPFLFKYLIEIENIIQQKEQDVVNARTILSRSVYTVKSIADELGKSRTTFYSYDKLLQRYVEYSLLESNANNPLQQIETCRETIREMKEKIAFMESRDTREMLLKYQTKYLKDQLKSKDHEIERLRAKLNELCSQK